MSEFRKLINQIMENHAEVNSNMVSNICENTQNAWSLKWWVINAPDQVVGKAVEHPSLGKGFVNSINEGVIDVKWSRLGSWVQNSNKVTLEEAECIAVTGSDKYLHKLSEEIGMTKIDMTADDYSNLMEDLDVPRPSETILTKQSDFKSDAGEKPLSGLDGDGGANPTPRDDVKAPSDAPDTPAVASMEEPSRTVSMKSGGNNKKPASASSDGDSGNSFKKKEKSEKKDKEEEKDMSESLTFEDFDLEAPVGDESMFAEHDMAAGEIAVTQDFMKKLLSAVVVAALDDAKVDQVVAAIADCCGEDRTLDVADIASVMSALRGDEPVADVDAEGDMEDEGVALMGDDEADVEECRGMEEGSQEDRARGRRRQANKSADRDRYNRDERGAGRDKPKYRKPKSARVDESVERLDEAWLSSIPKVGNKREEFEIDGEESEIENMKRLAGM